MSDQESQITRRNFLKGLGGGAISLTALGALSKWVYDTQQAYKENLPKFGVEVNQDPINRDSLLAEIRSRGIKVDEETAVTFQLKISGQRGEAETSIVVIPEMQGRTQVFARKEGLSNLEKLDSVRLPRGPKNTDEAILWFIPGTPTKETVSEKEMVPGLVNGKPIFSIQGQGRGKNLHAPFNLSYAIWNSEYNHTTGKQPSEVFPATANFGSSQIPRIDLLALK